MSDYIDFGVVGRVIGIGILLGAGLPLVFAFGLRALSTGTMDAGTGEGSSFALTTNQGARALGGLCFVVVAAAIAFGIFIIIHKS